MGAVNGCFIPRGEFDKNVKTSTPREKGHRRNLSATFNMSVVENVNADTSLVNINKATEEELMTLPCVNRTIARSIVDYRNHIGGFRRVEDVALTPGVGAVKLAMMRNEIYVDSLSADQCDEGSQNPSLYKQISVIEAGTAVCINTSNIFKLLSVKGIGMTIAKNIVAYREKHGRYKKVDELLYVKGIQWHNFEEMRPYLTVEDKHQTTSKVDDNKNGNCVNGMIGNKSVSLNHLDKEYVRRSTSSIENLLDILGPLAKVPERPKVDKVSLTHKSYPVFRVASWNLDNFSVEKANNPGVKDVVCMTVLENGFGLVAVQELMDKEALNEICKELNSPTLPNLRKWTGRRGQWSSVISEPANSDQPGYQGFIYDTSQSIELVNSRLLCNSSDSKHLSYTPFMGIFKINKGMHVVVVNVHFKNVNISNDNISQPKDRAQIFSDIVIALAAAKEVKGEQLTVIVGDFQQISNTKAASDDQLTKNYIQCIPSGANTSTNGSNNTDGVYCDNILVRKEAKHLYTGVSKIIRDGLSSNWIPNGWSWGGVASSHCPVYAQMFSTKELPCETV